MKVRPAVSVLAVAIVAALAGCTAGTSAAEPTASTTPPAPTSIPSPTPTPTAEPAVTPTCEDIATRALLAAMADAKWVAVPSTDSSYFDGFPTGAPAVSISCIWSADPTVGTDNVAVYGWAVVDDAAASAAIEHFVSAGWIRTDAPEGTYVGVKGEGGPVSPDAEGYNETYLFTKDDVRFADTKAGLKDVKAPAEQD